jgi:hypothetical protein
MKGADIGLGWIDNSGNIHFQVLIYSFYKFLLNFFSKDRYAFDFARPIIDNTTNDWFVLQGQESNGWTAIQFKRLLDTCDSMDYPIKVSFHFIFFS